MTTKTLYHATNESAANSIDYQGFRRGGGGRQGSAVYLSETPSEARRRSRNGNSVVYAVKVKLYSSGYGYDGESYAIYDTNQIRNYYRCD